MSMKALKLIELPEDHQTTILNMNYTKVCIDAGNGKVYAVKSGSMLWK